MKILLRKSLLKFQKKFKSPNKKYKTRKKCKNKSIKLACLFGHSTIEMYFVRPSIVLMMGKR